MSGVIGKRASLGQANGPEVELIVSGTVDYAHYETLDGYPVIYDESLGLFCYARVVGGEFQSTGVGVSAPLPSGVERHVLESDAVRERKINMRQEQRERRARGPLAKEKMDERNIR